MNDSVNGSVNGSGAIPGGIGRGREWKGRDVGHPSILNSLVGNFAALPCPAMGGQK